MSSAARLKRVPSFQTAAPSSSPSPARSSSTPAPAEPAATGGGPAAAPAPANDTPRAPIADATRSAAVTRHLRDTTANQLAQRLERGGSGSAAAGRRARALRETLPARLITAGVPEDQRTRIKDRLHGLEGEALVRETGMLDHALRSENAVAAVRSYDDLATQSGASDRAGQRLDADVREAMVRGVADRRSNSDTGREGIMSPHTAHRSAEALVDMPEAQYRQTRDLLKRAGRGSTGRRVPGSDAHAERALILESIGARRDELRETHADRAAARAEQCRDTPASLAMAEVSGFAGDIRGESRREMINTTTLLDVDARNTSRVDPSDVRGTSDTRGNNDGLYQRFEDSCGPTTAQLVRGEADPIFARSVHDEGIGDADPTTPTAREQERVLEANGGVAVSRRAQQAWNRMGTVAGDLGDDLPQNERQALISNIQGQPHDAALASAAIDRIRAADAGHPTAAELDAMRSDAGQNSSGMVLPPALQAIASPSTGVTYGSQWTGGGLNAAQHRSIDTALSEGRDVPLRVARNNNSNGHFMMISDARGTGDQRRYLVSDPWSGRTAWVRSDDLDDGSFLNRQLGLSQQRVTHIYPGTVNP